MGFKFTTSKDYDSIEVELIKFPHAFQAKCEEYVAEGNAKDIEDAKRQLKDCRIDLELFYDKHNGLFGVESEATENHATIVSPYTGEEGEEPHVCPECDTENCRPYLDVTDCGDVEGWQCDDCGFQGSEALFTEF